MIGNNHTPYVIVLSWPALLSNRLVHRYSIRFHRIEPSVSQGVDIYLKTFLLVFGHCVGERGVGENCVGALLGVLGSWSKRLEIFLKGRVSLSKSPHWQR